MLLVLYGVAVALVAWFTGIPFVVGFIIGTGAHGTLRGPRPLNGYAVVLALFTFMIGLSRLPPVGMRIGYYVGALCYGWFYWDRAERTGARMSTWFRTGFGWKVLRAMLSHRIKTPYPQYDLQPWETTERALYICHPHGVFALGATLCGLAPSDRARLNILAGVHWLLFALPGVREFVLAMGCVVADRDILRRLLDKGHSIMVIPEGTRAFAPRLTQGRPERDGYMQLAFEAQVRVILIITPSEKDTYLLWEPASLDSVRTRTLAKWKYPFLTLFAPLIPPTPFLSYAAVVNVPGKKETLEKFKTRIAEVKLALTEYSTLETMVRDDD